MIQKLESIQGPIETLNRSFLLNYPKDAARKIETMVSEEASAILNEQPVYILQPVWEHLVPGVSDRLLSLLDRDKGAELLTQLDPGYCAALLGRYSAGVRKEYFDQMDPGIAKELQSLLEYPENSAGRMMNTRIPAFNAGTTVQDAVTQLRNQKVQELSVLFVLDDSLKLAGQVDIQKIALAEPEQQLASLARPVKAVASILDLRDEVVDKFQKLKVPSIPVIDGNERLVGIIQETSIIDALKETLSADLQTMVGASKDERALSSSWFAVRKRQPWLQINLVTAFLAAAVVGMFEGVIAEYTALAILLPIAAGQSGNTGAQALAVTMRGLTLREITVRHWLRVCLKESAAGIINGTAIAISCGACVFIWSQSPNLALIIALAMISSMTIAAVAGALVPILLKRFGQDPALSSSIILTTITDIAGFMSFLGIATLLL